MSDDFGSFKQGDGTEPVDGEHTAYLERANVRDTKNGKAVKCEWRTVDLAHYWESWHNTTGGGKGRTQQLLEAIGVNLDALNSWDELGDELAQREGGAYIVKVSRSSDGRFLNTAVVERSQGVQTSMNGAEIRQAIADIPADVRGLPEATAPAPAAAPASSSLGDLFGDDVPF